MAHSPLRANKRTLSILLLALTAGMCVLWLVGAPAGLEGKLHAVGYGVCHQIESRTYMINGMLLPLCSRCSGLFLGALSTIAVLSSQSRRGEFPKAKFGWILILFVGFYLIDGVNSTLFAFSGWHGLYTPSNLLRLISGAGMGISLGVILMSIWNQVLWVDAADRPLLDSYKLLGMCAAAGALAVLLVIIDLPLTYYPLAILMSGGVVLLLAMVYTLLWTLALKRDNTLHRWQDASWLFMLGVLSALVQLALTDGLRLWLTGTWSGFML